MEKAFIYLNPVLEQFEQELLKNVSTWRNTPSGQERQIKLINTKPEDLEQLLQQSRVETMKKFRKLHYDAFNDCIHLRYRKQKYTIIYFLKDGKHMPTEIDVHKHDYVLPYRNGIQGGMTDERFIMSNFHQVSELRVGGFYLWDEVERFAAYAWKLGKKVMIDEDLTELFAGRILERNFQRTTYPGINPYDYGEAAFNKFMEDRRGKPWLFRNYERP
ncbi:MAG TPA: hypothetical protein VLJ21_02795 [Candidatus Binatia bacterium]|nr:hypothetical protein [Candidatus Binatia bacterium]